MFLAKDESAANVFYIFQYDHQTRLKVSKFIFWVMGLVMKEYQSSVILCQLGHWLYYISIYVLPFFCQGPQGSIHSRSRSPQLQQRDCIMYTQSTPRGLHQYWQESFLELSHHYRHSTEVHRQGMSNVLQDALPNVLCAMAWPHIQTNSPHKLRPYQ